MMSEQLELFSGTKPNQTASAFSPKRATNARPVFFPETGKNSTVPFPADRQIAHVRRVARALDARDERLAAKYWRTECNRLMARLQVQGFDAATIRSELVRFGNAVARHRRGHQQQPPGAA